MMYKICIWENIASPHQSAFFKALTDHPNIDLQVRYFEKFHEERIKLGWSNNDNLPINEQYVTPEIDSALNTVEDWKERIHVVPGNSYEFTQNLINILIENNVKWIHWSERSGISLANKLNYNIFLFKLLQPFVSKITKQYYAKKINKYALGVFSQGNLAKNDFIAWGVEKSKIENLFYTVDNLTIDDHFKFNYLDIKNKKIFMCISSLEKRKGIEYLIEAFSKIENNNNWVLIFIGHHKSDINYKELCIKYNINDKVYFLGAQPISEIANFMDISDVFILPTLFDGWGAVLNEAAQVGKPIISTDQCSSALHIIKQDRNGILTQAGNVRSLMNALEFYIKNPEKIEIHGSYSKKIYFDEFTPQKNVERFLVSLNKWLEQKGKNEEIY